MTSTDNIIAIMAVLSFVIGLIFVTVLEYDNMKRSSEICGEGNKIDWAQSTEKEWVCFNENKDIIWTDDKGYVQGNTTYTYWRINKQ